MLIYSMSVSVDGFIARTNSGSRSPTSWCAILKAVFSRTLDGVQGNARLAEASVADEAVAALGAARDNNCRQRPLARPGMLPRSASVFRHR